MLSRTAMLLIVIVALLASCSGNGDGDEEQPLNPDEHGGLFGLAEPSERQLEIVGDGEVSFADYEEAVFAHIQCLLDEDFIFVEEPRLDNTGTWYIYQMRPATSIGGPDRPQQIYRECRDRHLGLVARAWSRVNAPTEEQRQAALVAMEECLRDAGIDVPEPFTSEEDFAVRVQEAPEVFEACIRRVSDEYRVGWTRN